MTSADVPALVPEIALLAGAALVAAGARLRRIDAFVATNVGVVATLAAAAAASLAGVGHDLFGGVMRRDSASVFFTVLISTAAAASIAIDRGRVAPRTVALLLIS